MADKTLAEADEERVEKAIDRIYNMVYDSANAEFFSFPKAGSLKMETAANTLKRLLIKHHDESRRHNR